VRSSDSRWARKNSYYIIMPVRTKTGSWGSSTFVEATPKKTRQGEGKHTKYAASSRNNAKKKYRGQGK